MKIDSVFKLPPTWVSGDQATALVGQAVRSATRSLSERVSNTFERIVALVPNGELSIWEKSMNAPEVVRMEQQEREVKSLLIQMRSAVEQRKISIALFRVLLAQLQSRMIALGTAGSKWDHRLEKMALKLSQSIGGSILLHNAQALCFFDTHF